jgi:hypothetical protein
LFGCVSQPIKPTPPPVAKPYIQDVGPTSSAVSETQSKNFWSALSPFSVTGWKYSSNSFTVNLKNVDGTKITLNEINMYESLVFSTDTNFNPGETKAVTAILPSSCGSAGSRFSIDGMTLVYTKNSISGLSQKGNKPIVGTCS